MQIQANGGTMFPAKYSAVKMTRDEMAEYDMREWQNRIPLGPAAYHGKCECGKRLVIITSLQAHTSMTCDCGMGYWYNRYLNEFQRFQLGVTASVESWDDVEKIVNGIVT